MSTYTESADKVQAQAFDTIKQIQVQSLQTINELNKLTTAFVAKAAELSPLSTPHQVIETTFVLTQLTLDAQKSQMTRLADALAPLTKVENGKSAAK